MKRTVGCALFALSLFYSSYAQSGQKKNKQIVNSTKLELVYKGYQVNEYGGAVGGRSFFVSYPYLRINNAKPVLVDRHADILRTYFSHCQMADLQLDEMNRQIRRSRWQFWGGAGLGVGTALSGVFAMANTDNTSVFWSRVGIGTGLMLAGTYLGHLHMKKADEHLRESVDIYSAQCYKPVAADSSKPQPKTVSITPSSTASPSPRKYYQDQVGANLIRNDSKNSGLFGVIVNPVIADVHLLNMNVAGGAELFYTYKSLIGISADYRVSYLDDIQGHSRNKVPYGTEDSYGIPSAYTHSWQANVLAKVSVVSWQKTGSYHMKLGTEKIGPGKVMAFGHLKAEVTRAITIRGGFQLDQRIVESDNGIQFRTTTAPYQYHGAETYSLTPDNLATSSAILKSGIVAGGVGYSSFRDAKIHLDDDKFKGEREEKAQTDLYLDLLYQQSSTWQDMTYYHALYPYSQDDIHMPQRLDISSSPIRKVGARLGYRNLTMNKPNFGIRTSVEVGIRPGATPSNAQENAYLQLGFGIVFGGRVASK